MSQVRIRGGTLNRPPMITVWGDIRNASWFPYQMQDEPGYSLLDFRLRWPNVGWEEQEKLIPLIEGNASHVRASERAVCEAALSIHIMTGKLPFPGSEHWGPSNQYRSGVTVSCDESGRVAVTGGKGLMNKYTDVGVVVARRPDLP